MDEFPLSSGEERALGKLAKSGDAGISSRFDDAILRAYRLAPSKESLLLRAEEDIGKMSDRPRLPSVFEVSVQDASTSRPPPAISSSSEEDVRSDNIRSLSPPRKTSSRGAPARTSSKAKSSSARTPTKAKSSSTRTPSKGASRKSSSSVPAPARTGSDPVPAAPTAQADPSSSPHHTSTPGASLPSPARAPAPAPSSTKLPANRRKLVLMKSPPARPTEFQASSAPSAKRPAEDLATPAAPSKRSKPSGQDQAPAVAVSTKVPAVTEATAPSTAAPSEVHAAAGATTPSTAAPSEVPISNVFTSLQSPPTSSSQPGKGDAPSKVAPQATRASPSGYVTRRIVVSRRGGSHDDARDIPERERTPSPTRADIELGPGGRYLNSFLDNWATIMLNHANVLENRSLRGEDLDEFVARHCMLVSYFSSSADFFT